MQLSAIKYMESFARNRKDVISLSQGVPFFQSDDAIRKSVVEAILSDKVDKYADPQGLLPLRNAIHTRLLGEHMQYDPDEIIVTAGAMEGLSACVLALTNPADEIIIPTPSYTAFFNLSDVAHLKISMVPLAEKAGWSLDLDLLKKAITKQTRAIVVCSPNNPTGSIYQKETLKEICSLAKSKNIFVILDETYRNMIYDSENLYTPAMEDKYKDIIIRVVSMSKDFALTGWRIGYIHADRSIITRILPVHDVLVNCAPVVSQYAGLAALQNERRIITEHQRILKDQREIMGLYLAKLREYLDFVMPMSAYFYFVKVYGLTDDVSFCMDLLEKNRVAVVPGSDFGQGGEGHIRLCFGRKKDDIIEGMERLTAYFRRNGSI